MLIQVRDHDTGGPVMADVNDNRMAQWRHFMAANPQILGLGAGDGYGRRAASDAVEAVNFSIPQLAFVEQKEFERWYIPLMFETLLGPAINYQAGEGATSVIYEIVDYVGMGKRISAAGDDIPYADVAWAQISMAIAQGGVGYMYNTEDLRAAAFTGRSLPAGKLRAAIMAWRRHMNSVALLGEAQSNFTGLYNNASVTTVNRPSGAVWDAATADTIINDLAAGFSAVNVATKGNSPVTKVVMPISSYELLQKARATTTDTTILEFLKRTRPQVEFYSDDLLVNLGAGATKRIVFFTPTDDNMVLHLPMVQRFLAPQFQDLNIKVPGEYKYGGLNIRRPMTAYYMDGV
jgi:hypothetical protein